MPPSGHCAGSQSAASLGCSPAPIAAASGLQRMFTLIETAKLNAIDPQAWLADVLDRIADHPVSRLDQLLPWHWKSADQAIAA